MLRRLLTIAALLLVLPSLAAPPRFNEISGPAANAEAMSTVPASPGLTLEEATNTATGETPASDVKLGDKVVPSNNSSSKKLPEQNTGSSRWRSKPAKIEPPKETIHKTDDELIPTQTYQKSTTEVLQQGPLHIYQAGYHGKWLVTTAKDMCRLQQNITDFGQVEFREGTALSLEFLLNVNHPPAGAGQARFKLHPPVWAHYSPVVDLGVIEMEPGEKRLVADTPWAQRIMSDMSQGRQPSVSFMDAADGQAEIRVDVSVVDFNSGLKQFDACRAQLLRYDFKQVFATTLDFNVDSSKISKHGYSQLDSVLEVLKVDPGIKDINIEIYVQAKELIQYNYRLATRRARAIRDYLIGKGIDEERLKIMIHTKKPDKLKEMGIKSDQVQIILQRNHKNKKG